MTNSSSFILHPGDGDVLKFGPPISGELIINVDARRSGSSFAMGTQTLQPGGVLPTIRHLGCDQVLFVHKGQGRVNLEGRSLTVVPGTMIYVPRQTWYGLRNTGTGFLEMTWTAAPPGIEDFFRELAQIQDFSDAAARDALAQRHGVEFRPETESAAAAAAPEGGRRRRHRGRRGGQSRLTQAAPAAIPQGYVPAASAPVAPPIQPPPAAATPVDQQQPSRRRRRHRGGRGRSGASARPSPAPQSKTAVAPAAAHAPAPKQPSVAKPQRTGQRSGRGRPHRGRMKEVYMDGRWVQVSGEGPVIAPGREYIRDKKSSGRDEDTPPGPLTVPL